MTDYLEIVREVIERREDDTYVGLRVMRREVTKLVEPVFGAADFGKQARAIVAHYLAAHKLTDSERLGLTKRLYNSMAGLNGQFVKGCYPRRNARARVPTPAKPVVVARVAVRVKPRSNRSFYDSRQWLELRYEALRRHGGRCLCCGRSAKDGIVIHVDHVKPRSNYPELELDIDNLQVLCHECNLGKLNIDQTDWRPQ